MLEPHETVDALLKRARAEAKRRKVNLSTISRLIFKGDHRRLAMIANNNVRAQRGQPQTYLRPPTLMHAFDMLRRLEAATSNGESYGKVDDTEAAHEGCAEDGESAAQTAHAQTEGRR